MRKPAPKLPPAPLGQEVLARLFDVSVRVWAQVSLHGQQLKLSSM